MKAVKTLARVLVALTLFATASSAFGRTYTGKASGKYPVTVVLNRNNSGEYSGKYAYNSTLRKNGDKRSSWLYISEVDCGVIWHRCNVYDNSGRYVEEWMIYDYGSNTPSEVRVTTGSGKEFEITLHPKR